jgi:ligand-binding sensor domain-containing protein/two-component sensor histidine kinase
MRCKNLTIKSLFFITGLLLAGSVISYPQGKNFYFEHLSLEEGLSQSSVLTIFQDKSGFLWFGTANGLNKYDGYNFTVYKHNPLDSNSLSNDIINAIAEDKNGNLWVGTENGLNVFEVFEGKFKHFISTNKGDGFNYIMSLHIDKDNNIWFGTFGAGLGKFNLSDQSFTYFNISPDQKNISPFNYVWNFTADDKNNLWLCTNGGLVKFNLTEKTFKNYNPQLKINPRLITSYLNNQNELWFGTDGSGLFSFDIKNEKFSQLKNFPAGYIRTIFKDSKGFTWLGTYDEGLIFYDHSKKSYQKIMGIPGNFSALSDNNITAIYEDHSGILWFGTLLGGLNKFINTKRKFEHIKNEPGNTNSLGNNVIYSLEKEESGIIWIGTTNGLSRYDRAADKFKHYSRNDGIENLFITDILEDGGHNLWVCTSDGLYKYEKGSDRFRKIKLHLSNGKIYSQLPFSVIYEDRDNNLWIGNRQYGLLKFDRGKELFTVDTLFYALPVISIHQDKNNIFWLGTNQGLIKYTPGIQKLTYFRTNPSDLNSISNNMIFDIYEDENENLWIGTYGGGLNKYNKRDHKFTHFYEMHGLPNNVIYSIMPDENGNLWLSTNKGLCRFNRINNSIRSFDVSDGLQSFEFNQGAAALGSDGEILFGGVNGFNTFYPDKITDNPHPPSVLITSIKCFDKEIDWHNKKISLSHNENFISFDFVALDYTNPKKNKYAYMLSGFDKEWIPAGNRRYASYTNLEPGKYKFKVKGSNSDDIWNETGASINFIINPPFWRTWWFYTISIAMFILIVFTIHRYRLHTRIKKIVELENMRKTIADDFHDELGHKLTRISLYSEMMKRNLNGNLNGNEVYLNKINEAANNLYDDTKDFIWSIDPVKDTLYDLAVYLKDFGDEIFDRTNIAFMVKEISVGLSVIKLPMDWKRQLILIFKEAMNNILRHSNCKNVELSVELKDNTILINLFDDGKGFTETDDYGGRGLVNMRARALRLGAELDIESKTGIGTKIYFKGNTKLILN